MPRLVGRAIGRALAAVASLGALFETGRLLRAIPLAATQVPWVDEWVMLEEMWRFRDGRYGAGYLWTPYWGHRIVLPRLIFLLDEQWFHYSMPPLVAINVAGAFLVTAILLTLEWRLLKNRSRQLAVAVMAMTAYLLFSALQMENFIYGMSIEYGIGYGAAVAAIACAAFRSRRGFALSAVCGLVSTLTIATGLAVWPVLLGVNVVLRRGRIRLAVLAAMGVALSVAYGIGYSQPGNGMGADGMARHPWEFLSIAAMYLGGPLSLASRAWGEAAGLTGVILTFYLVWMLIRRPRDFPAEFTVLTAICVFVVLISLAVPLVRITPQWLDSLHGAAPLPGRYLTQAFLFWSCLTAAVCSLRPPGRMMPILIVAAGGVVFSTIQREGAYLRDWLNFSQRLEAAGSGLLMGAADQEEMARSYPDQRLLDHWTPYLREHRLAVFSERRANWPGRTIANSLVVKGSEACGLTMQSIERAERGWRARGLIFGDAGPFAKRSDLVFADASGLIVGVGLTYYVPELTGAQEQFLGYLDNASAAFQAVYLATPDGTARRCDSPR